MSRKPPYFTAAFRSGMYTERWNGYEQIGRGRLTNDTLIGASAARRGITLLTVNERDSVDHRFGHGDTRQEESPPRRNEEHEEKNQRLIQIDPQSLQPDAHVAQTVEPAFGHFEAGDQDLADAVRTDQAGQVVAAENSIAPEQLPGLPV